MRTPPDSVSPAAWLASQPPPVQARWLASLSDRECDALETTWPFWARDEQLPPRGAWRFWLFRGGRGGGKTRAGAEWVRAGAESGRYRRIAIIGPTATSARQVMIEGPSGLLSITPAWCRPVYEPSKQELHWPNGAVATLYSADVPERLRGPQHEAFWADELCAWRQAQYAWDMLLMGLRLGTDPRGMITTTPRVMPLYKQLLDDPSVVVTVSPTARNAANLAPAFLDEITSRYAGTRLGRQELDAELIEDVEGALWRREWIDDHRLAEAPPLSRVVVAIDPAVTSSPNSSETGIVVAGCDEESRHMYVLADYSLRASPDKWAYQAVLAYYEHRADRLVVEANQGGDLVALTLQTVADVPVHKVQATRGKWTRAEPVAALYEQGRVHHVGTFPELEDQLCLWNAAAGEPSPDRLDALVWALTALLYIPPPLKIF